MNLYESLHSCITKYATFKGRASKSEFWWFQFSCGVLIPGILVLIFPDIEFSFKQDGRDEPPSLGVIYILLVYLPLVSVTVRRLHDANKSGWWYFFPIPIFFNSTKGENRFGAQPTSATTSKTYLSNVAEGIKKGNVVYTKIDGINIYAFPDSSSTVLFASSKGDEFIYTGEVSNGFIQVFNSNAKGWIDALSVNRKI